MASQGCLYPWVKAYSVEQYLRIQRNQNILFHWWYQWWAIMQPLDDFYYFAKVLEHGGYAKAARALRIPKSRLSRHVAALETRLGVRLLNRSTRRFVVTDVGQEVRRHALAMLAEADAAVEAVEFARAEPRGLIKASCPIAVAQTAMAQFLPAFLARYPNIRLE